MNSLETYQFPLTRFEEGNKNLSISDCVKYIMSENCIINFLIREGKGKGKSKGKAEGEGKGKGKGKHRGYTSLTTACIIKKVHSLEHIIIEVCPKCVFI